MSARLSTSDPVNDIECRHVFNVVNTDVDTPRKDMARVNRDSRPRNYSSGRLSTFVDDRPRPDSPGRRSIYLHSPTVDREAAIANDDTDASLPDICFSVSNDVRPPLQRPRLVSPSCTSRSRNDSGTIYGVTASDFHAWKSTIHNELVITQNYLNGINSLEMLDFRAGGLPVAQKTLLDAEYEKLILEENRMGSRRYDTRGGVLRPSKGAESKAKSHN